MSSSSLFPPSFLPAFHGFFNEAARSFVAGEEEQKRLTAAKKKQLKIVLTRLSHEIFRKFDLLNHVDRPVEPLDVPGAQRVQAAELAVQQKMKKLKEIKLLKLKGFSSQIRSELRKLAEAPASLASSNSPQTLRKSERAKIQHVEELKENINKLANAEWLANAKREAEQLKKLLKPLEDRGDGDELARVLGKLQEGAGSGKMTKRMSAARATRLAAQQQF